MDDDRAIVHYSDELAAQICEHLASGLSLKSFCYGKTSKYELKDPLPGRPSHMTIYRWLRRYPHFLEMYNIARSDQADTHVDQINDIAEDETICIKTRRLMVDTLKWTAGKMKPKKYGDRVQIAGDDDSPFKVSTELQKLTDDELTTIASVAIGVLKKG